ncbi:ATP-binding protein [Flavobacteriaceae bacterium F89]|uniref:ATP-binding protein n=1 Tax=Cerina litoralis TaxID=2874477 RepID=A0AAE3EWR1_9FLAO|nr:ATP-binding protein [Cerina litoralis]MCG2462293.1 ATP-binding protein [Cerina litoralis]
MREIFNFFGLRIQQLESVFTPSNAAKVNYINRPDLEKKVDKALKIVGTQLIIYGHSGSGKTTLIRKALNRNKRNFIKTSCISTSTLEELIVNAFDKLNPFYSTKKSKKRFSKITPSLKIAYAGIGSALQSELSIETSTEFQRVLPVQLTFEKLAEFLGAANCVWLIDDFHKVQVAEKKKLAEVMKAFVDISDDYPEVKIIALGAVNSPREVVNYNKELKPRLSETYVPLLSNIELRKIIENGAKLLNIEFPENLVKQTISYANSLGSICHILAYNHCDLNGIDKTCRIKKEIPASVINESIEDYVKDKADNYQEKLDNALKQRERKFKNARLILNAIIKLNKENVTHNEILTKIHEVQHDYPQGNCTTYLKKLISSDGNEILRVDENSGTYSFSDPFFKAYCKMALDKLEKENKDEIGDIKEILLKDLIEKIRFEIKTNAYSQKS